MTQLPAIDPDPGDDHPEEVAPEEASEGQRIYEAIDDLDDDSTGLDQ